MADQDTQTQTGATAGTAAATSEAVENTAGSTTSEPKGGQVEGQAVEDSKGNTGQGDAGNGADTGEGERQRPSRAERRISQLEKELQELRSGKPNDDRVKQLLADPISAAQVKLPDYSQADSVTPEQFKTDLVSAADQLVKLRLNQVYGELQGIMTRSNANTRTLAEMDYVQAKYPQLNPSHEKYDANLDATISKTFKAAYSGNPDYSLRELVDGVMGLWSDVETSSAGNTASTKKRQAAEGAIRQTSGKATSQKDPSEMTAAELETYIKAKNR